MKPFVTDGSVDQAPRARLYCVCGCEHFLYDPLVPRTHVYVVRSSDDRGVILMNYVGTGTLKCLRCGSVYKISVGSVEDDVAHTEWAMRVVEDGLGVGG